MIRILKIFTSAENFSKGGFINFLPRPSNRSSWTPQDRGILSMLGETTCLFRPAENEPGNYFAHPDGDCNKTDGNNQERRWILTLRAGGEKKGNSWHSREKEFCGKRQWKHRLPCTKPPAVGAPLLLRVDVSGHAARHRRWFHLTQGNVLTSSGSHCHQAALLTAPSFRALLICCAACSIPSSAERIPEVKRFPGWELLLLGTRPSRPNSPQR